MSYRFLGFYPAHYDTRDGSRYVEPGEIVDWDTPPDSWWEPVADRVPPAPRQPEPAPAPASAAKSAEE